MVIPSGNTLEKEVVSHGQDSIADAVPSPSPPTHSSCHAASRFRTRMRRWFSSLRTGSSISGDLTLASWTRRVSRTTLCKPSLAPLALPSPRAHAMFTFPPLG